jgi:DNA-binding response OmpR family regulator
MIETLVVDDGTILTATVLACFDPTIFHLTVVTNAVEAQRQLQPSAFDVLLLATHLDYRSFCRRLRSDPLISRLPIISLGKTDDLDERLSYYRMGTDDFLTSPFDGRELVARIHAVLQRSARRSLQQEIMLAAGGMVELDVHKKIAIVGGVEFHLTRLEYLLLYHLIQLAGNYVSTEELLETVWGYGNGTGDPALVRAQIKNLRRKFQTTDPKLSWLQSMPGLGYQIAV